MIFMNVDPKTWNRNSVFDVIHPQIILNETLVPRTLNFKYIIKFVFIYLRS